MLPWLTVMALAAPGLVAICAIHVARGGEPRPGWGAAGLGSWGLGFACGLALYLAGSPLALPAAAIVPAIAYWLLGPPGERKLADARLWGAEVAIETAAARGGAVGLDAHGIEPRGAVLVEPPGRRALRARARGGRRRARRGRRARRLDRRAHRPRARRTSTSSASPAARTASGGARSTSRSTPPSTPRWASGCAPTWAPATSTSSTPSPAPTRPTACRCAWSPRAPGTPSSPAPCSSSRPTRSSRRTGPRPSSSTPRASPPTPPPTAPAPPNFVSLHLTDQEILIGGTDYAGEIKKSIFTLMNDRLPQRGVLSMHCSANVGADGRVAVFFGLSGTGKTTLSTDSQRPLIGDDEHGWSEDGVFNIEGGCYAKVIKPLARPPSRRSTPRPTCSGPCSRTSSWTRPRAASTSTTTRSPRTPAAPIRWRRSRTTSPSKRAGHPSTIVMLTADAFGVLPPVAKLTPEEAMTHVPRRLHGEGRRHRGRRRRAAGHVQRLLRRALPAPAARGLRGAAARAHRAARRERLARQHRLDRRALRHRLAHADRRDPGDRARRPVGRARRRADPHRPDLRLRGARPRCRASTRPCSTRAAPGTTRRLRRGRRRTSPRKIQEHAAEMAASVPGSAPAEPRRAPLAEGRQALPEVVRRERALAPAPRDLLDVGRRRAVGQRAHDRAGAGHRQRRARGDLGGRRRARRAQSAAGSTTSSTSPIARASSASTGAPVRNRRRVRAGPIAATKRRRPSAA